MASGLFGFSCLLFAQPVNDNTVHLYAFSDLGISPKTDHLFHAGLLTNNSAFVSNHRRISNPSTSGLTLSSIELIQPDLETKPSLFQRHYYLITKSSAFEKRNSIVSAPKRDKVNYKRASVIGMVNIGAITLGYKQAIKSWGRSNGEFHIKDDWKGDHLAQTDELSHFLWGYKMTQFFFENIRMDWTLIENLSASFYV